MFVLGEKVVYAGHGVASISRIIEKKMGGTVVSFFELKFVNKDMTVLVPTNNLEAVGVRRLSSRESVNNLFKLLSEPCPIPVHDSVISNWNKRNKEYQNKLRSGNLNEICKIYRDLKQLSIFKELSFGEKNLLHQTEALLVEEIALVENVKVEEAVAQLRSVIYNVPKNMQSIQL